VIADDVGRGELPETEGVEVVEFLGRRGEAMDLRMSLEQAEPP
jgi:hypothetical protein